MRAEPGPLRRPPGITRLRALTGSRRQSGRLALFGAAPAAQLFLGARALALRPAGGPARKPVEAGEDLREIGGEATLADAADALRALLAAHPRVPIDVRLACAWSRLLLLPWVAQLTREERWNNYARARFEEIFGDGAQGWEIRVARDLPGRNRLAVGWPARLQAELAAARQLRSVRVDLLEYLGVLLRAEPDFTGALGEIDVGGAGFILLVGGQLRRVRWSRFDDADGLVTALRAEWASVLAGATDILERAPALALTPPTPAAGSPRAKVAAAIAAGLGFKRAFSLA
jgi:hypothetical protein